jgi:hypothetical protein
VLLDAYLRVWPDSDLPPKLARGLLDHRVKGRWGSTQENAFVLLALKRYFEIMEGTPPSFVARAWLSDDFLGAFRFEGRAADTRELKVPLSVLARGGGARDLVLQQQGAGRLYYRLGLRYAPSDLRLDPLDRGFVVERTYEAVDDPGDVRRGEDGTWRVKAGARVRVTTNVVVPARRTHVALVNPLPAGLEVLNPALKGTESTPPPDDGDGPRPLGSWSWWWAWEHVNLRDDRVEAFASLLHAGSYEHSVLARATTPGRFVAPPPKAEEMYHPETFGRGGTDVVVVE